GIHSGDSACALQPYSLSREIIAELKLQPKQLARELRVNGLMNVQYGIKQKGQGARGEGQGASGEGQANSSSHLDFEIYVIEVNPRASRTVPFVGKATGVPWAKVAAKVMAGKTLEELGFSVY